MAGIDATHLAAFVADLFAAEGVPNTDARVVADSLVQADLWGHQSHGVMRVPWYIDRIRAGSMRPDTRPVVVNDARAVLVLDGCDGVGQVLASRAAGEAIHRANEHGVAAVAVRNSNHFGTAAYFTLMAPPAGCIGMLATNGSPAMAPWGGREKVVGNNPWSVAAPAGGSSAVVLDIAHTAVARGKIYLARQEGRSIPEGWALDATGTATTDPEDALEGVLLPMGGHKGYGLALMMDVLAGVLTGSGFLSQVSGPYQAEQKSRCGHLYIALRVDAFIEETEFRARMDDLVAEVKATPTVPGVDEILVPGELERRMDATARRDGLTLPERTLDDLRRLGAETAVAVPFD